MRRFGWRLALCAGLTCVTTAPTLALQARGQASAKVGEPAPALTLKDLHGKEVRLADLRGKIVVLEWLNKGCPYSVKACPTMVATAEKYASRGVVWLGIDSTHGATAQENLDYAAEKKIHYPILMDGDGKVGRAYGARTTPHMFVIDAKGTLVYAGAIDNRKSGADYRNYVVEALDALLAGKPVEVSETQPYGCTVKYKE